MNRERCRELLLIIQAFAEGKTIQSKYSSPVYEDDLDPSFNTLRDYRIKPEPMEIWVNKVKHAVDVYTYSSKEEAENAISHSWEYEYVAKHFREVIE